MLLDIQLFADESGVIATQDQEMTEVAETVTQISEETAQSTQKIEDAVTQVAETSTDEQTQQDLAEVNAALEQDSVNFTETLTSLTSIINTAVDIFSANKSQFSGEIQGWIQTFKSAISGAKQAYTAEGATQGMDTVTSAAKEMVASGIKISGYSRQIVNESVNMLVNGGKMVKGLTGQSPQELVRTGVGTIATLFGKASGTSGFSRISKIFTDLGSAASAFWTKA